MTLVCVPIMVSDPAAAASEAAAARAAGADLVEFRIDEFFTGEEEQAATIVRLVSESALPCIVTCRTAAEGGAYEGDDDARFELLKRVAMASGADEHPPRYLDVEVAAYERSASLRAWVDREILRPAERRDLAPALILSVHDFKTRPPDLLRRVARMAAEPAAAVMKVAYRARSLRDSLELLELAGHAAKPTIALGIGEFGLLSRVLAPKFNGFLTFATPRRESATAPGQPTLHELLHLYRLRAVGPATRVYGVVGWPVSQSLSPLVHNAGFEAVGHDGVYLPLPVAAGDDAEAGYASFKGTMLELIEHSRLNLCGCSVTIPHKENLVRLAREQGWGLDDASAAINAGNTLVIERNAAGGVASVRVSNTDAPALIERVREAAGSISGRTVLVLGSGGVARAAAWACARDGARVLVHARTGAKAAALVAHLGSLGLPPARALERLDAASMTGVDVVINCTPLGMEGAGAGTPLSDELLAALAQGAAHGRDARATDARATDARATDARATDARATAVVVDTVYTPRRTELLVLAEKRGLKTADGLGMFVRQAAAQFEAWTGLPAPLNLFARVAEEGGG